MSDIKDIKEGIANKKAIFIAAVLLAL